MLAQPKTILAESQRWPCARRQSTTYSWARPFGAVDAHEFRQEWKPRDLQYRDARIEVKASGMCQSWNPLRPSPPSFGVAAPK